MSLGLKVVRIMHRNSQEHFPPIIQNGVNVRCIAIDGKCFEHDTIQITHFIVSKVLDEIK